LSFGRLEGTLGIRRPRERGRICGRKGLQLTVSLEERNPRRHLGFRRRVGRTAYERRRSRVRTRAVRRLLVLAAIAVAAFQLDAYHAARDGQARLSAWQAGRVCAWASAARAWDAVSDGHMPPLPSCNGV
jgi:hypothetical protein